MVFELIEKSILKRLEAVRVTLQDLALVRGLSNDPKKAVVNEDGDVVVFIDGGQLTSVNVRIEILLPDRIRDQFGCYPILDKILGLLWGFIPESAISPFILRDWTLNVKGSLWLVTVRGSVSISIEMLRHIVELGDDTITGININKTNFDDTIFVR